MNKKLLDTLTLFGKRVAVIQCMADEIIMDAEETNSIKGQKISRDMVKIQQKLKKIGSETKEIVQYANFHDLIM